MTEISTLFDDGWARADVAGCRARLMIADSRKNYNRAVPLILDADQQSAAKQIEMAAMRLESDIEHFGMGTPPASLEAAAAALSGYVLTQSQ